MNYTSKTVLRLKKVEAQFVAWEDGPQPRDPPTIQRKTIGVKHVMFPSRFAAGASKAAAPLPPPPAPNLPQPPKPPNAWTKQPQKQWGNAWTNQLYDNRSLEDTADETNTLTDTQSNFSRIDAELKALREQQAEYMRNLDERFNRNMEAMDERFNRNLDERFNRNMEALDDRFRDNMATMMDTMMNRMADMMAGRSNNTTPTPQTATQNQAIATTTTNDESPTQSVGNSTSQISTPETTLVTGTHFLQTPAGADNPPTVTQQTVAPNRTPPSRDSPKKKRPKSGIEEETTAGGDEPAAGEE